MFVLDRIVGIKMDDDCAWSLPEKKIKSRINLRASRANPRLRASEVGVGVLNKEW